MPETPAKTFAAWLGVAPATGRMLAALHEAAGELVPLADLAEAARQTINGANLSIKTLRGAMDKGAIQSVRLTGYRLTEVGMAECARALADAAERAVA